MSLNYSGKSKLEERMKNILEFKNEKEKEEFELRMLSLQILNAINSVIQYYGWNKAKLAEEMGTSKSYITQLFKGDKIMNLSFIAKLKRIFKLKLNINFTLPSGEEINFIESKKRKITTYQSVYKTHNKRYQKVAERTGDGYRKSKK